MGFNYIVFRTGENQSGTAREFPIVYPDLLVHEDVAIAMKTLPSLKDATVVSAGSMDLSTGQCWGRSSTLKIESRGEEDRQLINSYPYFHGILP